MLIIAHKTKMSYLGRNDEVTKDATEKVIFELNPDMVDTAVCNDAKIRAEVRRKYYLIFPKTKKFSSKRKKKRQIYITSGIGPVVHSNNSRPARDSIASLQENVLTLIAFV